MSKAKEWQEIVQARDSNLEHSYHSCVCFVFILYEKSWILVRFVASSFFNLICRYWLGEFRFGFMKSALMPPHGC